MISAGVVLAAVVLIFYSVADIFGKKVVVKYGYRRAVVVVGAASMVPFLLLIAISGTQHMTSYSASLAVAAGIFYGLGFLLLYKSLATEQTTNTFALSEFFKAWLVILGAFILGEIFSLRAGQDAGIILIFLGSFMVILTEKLRINMKLVYALLGFICWAVLWTLMAYSILNSGTYLLEGLIAALFATLTGAVASFALPEKKPVQGHKGGMERLESSVAVGVAIGAGSLIFGYLILFKELAQGASIIALTPIVVAIASRKIYLDRLTLLQAGGLIVAVAGALLLAFF